MSSKDSEGTKTSNKPPVDRVLTTLSFAAYSKITSYFVYPNLGEETNRCTHNDLHSETFEVG